MTRSIGFCWDGCGPRMLGILTPVFRLWIRSPLAKSGEQDPIRIGEQIDLLRREDPIRIELWALQWQIHSNVVVSLSKMPWLIGPDVANLVFGFSVSIDVGAKFV